MMPVSLHAVSKMLLLWLVVMHAVGCSLLDKNRPALETRNYMSKTELREGYSLIFASASSLRHVDRGLFLKVESDDLDAVVSAVAEFAGDLRGRLQALEDAHGSVRLDLEPLPLLEQRRRQAMARAERRRFAPVVGLRGAVFEREMLLSVGRHLHELSMLLDVMAEGEPDTVASAAMLVESRNAQRLLQRIEQLLRQAHYQS